MRIINKQRYKSSTQFVEFEFLDTVLNLLKKVATSNIAKAVLTELGKKALEESKAVA